MTACDGSYSAVGAVTTVTLADTPDAIPVPYTIPTAALCVDGLLLLTLEASRSYRGETVTVTAELNVTEAAGDTFCEREITCPLFSSVPSHTHTPAGFVTLALSGCVGDGDAEPMRSGVLFVKPTRLKCNCTAVARHGGAPCYTVLQLRDVGTIPLITAQSEPTGPGAATQKGGGGWKSVLTRSAPKSKPAHTVLHWDKSVESLQLPFGVASLGRPLTLWVQTWAINTSGGQGNCAHTRARVLGACSLCVLLCGR